METSVQLMAAPSSDPSLWGCRPRPGREGGPLPDRRGAGVLPAGRPARAARAGPPRTTRCVARDTTHGPPPADAPRRVRLGSRVPLTKVGKNAETPGGPGTALTRHNRPLGYATALVARLTLRLTHGEFDRFEFCRFEVGYPGI